MIADIIGISGMTFLITAYFLVLYKKIKVDEYLFLFSNLSGATLLCINALMISAPWFYPLINVVWITGTVYQIVKKYKGERYENKIIYEMIKGMIKEKGIKPIDIIEAVKELKRLGFFPKEHQQSEKPDNEWFWRKVFC
jgi:tellurite resistance protein TehA-like permease